MERKIVSVILVDDFGMSNYRTEYEPIGVTENITKENIRSIVVNYLNNFNIGDEEKEWVDEVIETLYNQSKYVDIESEIAFKIVETKMYM